MSVELTYLYIVILENRLFLKIALLSYDLYRLKQEDTGQKKEVSFHDLYNIPIIFCKITKFTQCTKHSKENCMTSGHRFFVLVNISAKCLPM